MRYQYLHLKQLGIVGQYLNAFPQYMGAFERLRREYDEFITEVYSAYVKFYIKKERDLIPKKYFVHAAGIHHGIYLNPENGRRKITRETVFKYFDKTSPSKMFYNLTRDLGLGSHVELEDLSLGSHSDLDYIPETDTETVKVSAA
jgi:hypothetical protein